MAERYVVFIDESPQSLANVYGVNLLFNTWLRCYSRVDDALQFIRQQQSRYSIIVYLSRDNLFYPCPPPRPGDPPIELIDLLDKLGTIRTVHVFSHEVNLDLEKRYLINTYKRLIGEICSLIDLPILLASEGQSHLNLLTSHHVNENEPHVAVTNMPTIQQLIEYMATITQERKAEIERQVQKRADQSGQPPT